MKISILFVEDSQGDVKLCLAELRKSGFEVNSETVQDEDKFLAKLQTGSYDAIVSDYQLPGWTGIQAVEQLKKQSKDIPFILLTEYGEQSKSLVPTEYRGAPVISKPFEPNKMKEVLAQILGLSEGMSSSNTPRPTLRH